MKTKRTQRKVERGTKASSKVWSGAQPGRPRTDRKSISKCEMDHSTLNSKSPVGGFQGTDSSHLDTFVSPRPLLKHGRLPTHMKHQGLMSGDPPCADSEGLTPAEGWVMSWKLNSGNVFCFFTSDTGDGDVMVWARQEFRVSSCWRPEVRAQHQDCLTEGEWLSTSTRVQCCHTCTLTWIFPFDLTFYFYTTTFQRKILYFYSTTCSMCSYF